MSLIENHVAERRARLVRLGTIPAPTLPVMSEAEVVQKLGPEIIVPPVEFFYPNFWCWDLIACESRLQPTIRNIQIAVCKYYGVTVMDMVSHRRTHNISFPRQVAYYLTKILTGYSFPHIGRYFGGRDHTTVLSGIRKIEARIVSEPDLRETVNTLRRMFA